MNVDAKKLADSFEVAGKFLNQDERLLLASAVETVALEKQAGRLGDMSEEDIVLMGAALADVLLKE
jgi:hypothetical protein